MTITQLTENGSQNARTSTQKVDLVVIHGIFEEGLQTWTDSTSKVLWLKDLLPKSLPNVRVLVFEYKASTLISPGEGTADRILTQAQSLVAQLSADRQLDNASARPIIFMCHGLGGLLIKRALAYSDSKRSKAVEHLRSIFTSTYGILFLGTPHLGIDKETLLLAQENRGPGPSQFVINLLKGSEMLNEITDQFAPLMKHFSIYNFWEDTETQFGDRRVYIVDQDSAAPAWHDVEKCSMMGTHSSMVKFSSRSDHGYRLLLEALSRYARHAPALIESRWRNEHKSAMQERQQEAAELLQNPFQFLLPEDSVVQDVNEWCLVPRSPSAYFTGRQKHAKDVKDLLGPIRPHDGSRRNKLIVLSGLGGSGKTQFCLKYVEENKHRYWGVFWVDASDKKHIESGFASIGEQAGRGSTMSAGIYWLSKCTKPWLLVFDNADDPDLEIEEYCPSGGNGHILITTRNPRAAEQTRVDRLRFRGMEVNEAISFLLKVAYANGKREDVPATPKRWKLAEGIAIELGFLPLALAHAGATIRRNIYTLERYLDYYLGRRKITMSYSRVNTADDANIITTWEIPFQRIVNRDEVEHRDAVDLMHIFAFMHFEAIPESIFQMPWTDLTDSPSQYEYLPDLFQSGWSMEGEVRRRSAIEVLCDHSIIEYEQSKAACSMHPVIHNWARDRLKYEEQKQWLQCAMSVLARSISPNLEASGRRFRALLLPHINSCLQAHGAGRIQLPETIELAAVYERFAWVFAEQCFWTSARRWQQRTIEIRKNILGGRHHETIRAQRSLGQTLWNLFKIKEAIDVQLQVLNTLRWYRPSMGEWTVWPIWKPIHVPYCVALDDLTLTLWLAGKREISKMTGERAVAGLKTRLGPKDPKTLIAMFNLARTYLHLGEHEESHKLLVHVLKIQKRFFGSDHPDTLMTRNEVGISLCARRRHLAAAQRLIENVMQARRRILGAEHAYTLWSVNDLSKIYVERGRFDEAVKVLEDIVPIVKRTLGETHVGMSMTRSNLGKAYFMANRWKEAEETIALLLNDIPEDHPDRIHNLFGYAYIKFNLGAIDEAEQLCVGMLDKILRTKLLALNNPRTIAIGDLLIRVYRSQDRKAEAAKIKSRIPGTDVIKNEDHPDPYAIRKGSDTSVNIIKNESQREQSNSRSKLQGRGSHHSPRLTALSTERTPKVKMELRPKQALESKPKLVVRQTF